MTDHELIAKTVFGEATLGDVFSRFEYRISTISITLLRNTNNFGYDYHSWWIEDGNLVCVGGDETHTRKCSFNLDIKVKVRERCLELFDGKDTFLLMLLETKPLDFHEILPGAA